VEFEHVKWPTVIISIFGISIIYKIEENKVGVKDLGTKLNCQNCEAKFYDFNKKKPVCPKCDTEYVVAKTRTRRTTTKSENVTEVVDKEKVPVEKATVSADNETVDGEEFLLSDDSLTEIPEVEDEDEEEDNSLIEDTSDMGDDNDDIAGVVINNDVSDESA
jgi:uncharacterized protein (TIGR02300 family)